MSLIPTQKTPPKTRLSDMCVTIYGTYKVGKSTFCANAPSSVFLATEPGLDNLSCYQIPIDSWEKFRQAVDELLTTKHQFKTIVIDTGDAMYRWCCDWVCKKYNVDYVGNVGHGTGWGLVNSEIERVIRRIKASPYGLIITSHIAEEAKETRSGEITVCSPSMTGKSRDLMLGISDIILYACHEVETNPDGKKVNVRHLRTRGTVRYMAGQRGDVKEIPPLADPLPLDYAAFAQAFNESRSKIAQAQAVTMSTQSATAQTTQTKQAQAK